MSLISFTHVVDTMHLRLGYFNRHFAKHLRTSDIRTSEEIALDDPIWPFLDHISQVVHYIPAFDSDPHSAPIKRVWHLLSETLCWVQRHQEVGSVKCPFLKLSPANIIHPSAPQAFNCAPCPIPGI